MNFNSLTQKHLRYLALVLLLAYFAQGTVHARRASITFDEGPHLAVGYTTLRTGDFRLQPIHIHPPLANVLAALPLLLQHDHPDPRAVSGWNIASLSALTDALVWQYPHPARLALAGRLPILFLGMLLGALIFRWAAGAQNHTHAGLIALGLYTFDANFIAHGSLITTDMAAVCLSVATLYMLSKRTPLDKKAKLIKDLAVVGTLLGLAQLAKVSALMLVPVVGLILTRDALHIAARTSSHKARQFGVYMLRTSAAVFIPAALVIWAGYGFEIKTVPGWPLKIPAGTHVLIFQSLREHYDLGHPTFLMGQVSTHGWGMYFPIAFTLKTSLPILILVLWTGARGVHKALSKKPSLGNSPAQTWTKRMWTNTLNHLVVLGKGDDVLWVFPVLYLLSSLFSTVNIGYRHLLPVLPFLYISIGRILTLPTNTPVQQHQVTPQPRAVLLSLLLLWHGASTLRVAPHYLAFFNTLAGGPSEGYRYLVDSNLDWGQNLWDLKHWMDRHDKKYVHYAHYSPARPNVYGIDATFLPPDPRAAPFTSWAPQPGLYAIGATVLQGPYAPDVNTYAWFRVHQPVARLGHALWLYEVPSRPQVSWAVVCATPVPVLPPETLPQKLGHNALRILTLDCAQSWVYPAGNKAGLYVETPSEHPPPGTVLEVKTRHQNGKPFYAVYRHSIDIGVDQVLSMDQEHIASIGGPLTFLGYQVKPPNATTPEAFISFLSVWEVKHVPQRPLSLMAHLVGPAGTGISVGDGLGFPIEQWQKGDVIIQKHTLTLPENAPPGSYTIHTGGYWLDTMERWLVLDTAGQQHDAIVLPGPTLPYENQD